MNNTSYENDLVSRLLSLHAEDFGEDPQTETGEVDNVMEPESDAGYVDQSGTTSPEDAVTLFTSNRARSNSLDTVVSSVPSTSSTPSMNHPHAPVNSPEAQSIMGDPPHAQPADANTITERLRQMSPIATPPTSVSRSSSSGKARLRAPPNEGASLASQLFKKPKPVSKKQARLRMMTRNLLAGGRKDGEKTPTKLSEVENAAPPETGPRVFEYSVWEAFAEEDVSQGLMRLAMLAKDEHNKNPAKSVKEYYSVRLAKLIKAAELEFDVECLQ